MSSKTIQVDKKVLDSLDYAIENMIDWQDIQEDFIRGKAINDLSALRDKIEQAFKQTDMIFTEGVQSKWNQKCLRKKWTKQLWRF